MQWRELTNISAKSHSKSKIVKEFNQDPRWDLSIRKPDFKIAYQIVLLNVKKQNVELQNIELQNVECCKRWKNKKLI
jgi:hypothetical protein